MDETWLEFEGPEFTDASLKTIPNLEMVESLSMLETGVTDQGFAELLRAQSLVQIVISSDIATDALLDVLARLPRLRSLMLHSSPRIGDEGIRRLSGCVELRELYLEGTAVTDQGLRAISGLPHVWSLILDDTRVTDEGCGFLAEMSQLSLLSLKRTQIAGHGLALLNDTQKISIYLEESQATDEGVIAMAARLLNLKTLSLNRTEVGDPAAQSLAKLEKLNDVRFSHTQLTDAGLSAFSGHPHLEVVYVEGCARHREGG